MVVTEAFWPCGTKFLPGFAFLPMLEGWKVSRHMTSQVLHTGMMEESKAGTSSPCSFKILHRCDILGLRFNIVSKILSPEQFSGQQNAELKE